MNKSILLAAVAAVGLAGCASGPTVRAVSDKTADFTRYRSFAFVEPLGTDQRGYQTIVSQSLKAATQRELEARGVRYQATNPDLLVNFQAALSDKVRVSSTPTATMGVGYGRGGYYGYRGGVYSTWPLYQDQTTVTQYKEGTLNIDVVDASRKQLVWEGGVTQTVTTKSYDNLDATLSAAVTAAFAKYPVARPAAAKP